MLEFLIFAIAASVQPASQPFWPDVPYQEIRRAYDDCFASVAPQGLRRELLTERGWKRAKVKVLNGGSDTRNPDIRTREGTSAMISVATKPGENWCSVSAQAVGENAYKRLLAQFAGNLSTPDAEGKMTAVIDGRSVTVWRVGKRREWSIFARVASTETK